MTIARAQMNRQLYGIGNLVEREQYGIGSSLKKFVRNIIPNEVAKVASVAAPFVAPFNPALGAAMAGIGNFDRTGKIGSSLGKAALTYGSATVARGIGGAGFPTTAQEFVTSLNPFAGYNPQSGFMGLESLFTSPIGTQSGLNLGQFTDAGSSAINQMEPFGGSATTGTFSKAPGVLDQLKTIFNPTSNVDLGTRAKAAMDLSADAIKSMYTIPDGKGGREIDKRAVIATLSAIPSYLDAKKKADQIGLASNEFNEQVYNEQKAMYQSAYQSRLPMESFGIRTTAQTGGIMNGLQQQQQEPIFPRLENLSENLGQAEQTLGQPSNQSNNSPMTSLMMGPQGFAEGGLLSIQLTPVQKMAMGGEIPVRQNQGGISELDLRAKGGYIPVGIKEKADDVPAMLSKNEFVFTADAVRGAGNGSINKGAQKMYKLMKSLEKKVKKTKVA
jgi:hypothetical protein